MAVTTEGTGPSSVVKCSFCGKPQQVVAKLIAGPDVYICDECVSLCVDVMSEEGIPVGDASSGRSVLQIGETLITGGAREVRQEIVALAERISALARWLDQHER